VIGVDLIKDKDVLYRAYNDAEGVTAKFNLNLLVRINRELGQLQPERFRASRVL
jgi:L-histidine N-alpha-methyltransferase